MSIKNNKNEKGFTIVELLIVIVIIGILAAITIVAYNGIQNRGKTASAASAATNLANKAEAYNIDGPTPGYPMQSSDMTGATSDKSYAVASTSITVSATAITAAPATPATVNFWRCGTAAAAAATSLATVTVVTGTQVKYWDYTAGSLATDTAGATSGNSAAGYNITCYLGT
jgi:prepilin-type N-terminal cleavage/methylation domain-containing protein